MNFPWKLAGLLLAVCGFGAFIVLDGFGRDAQAAAPPSPVSQEIAQPIPPEGAGSAAEADAEYAHEISVVDCVTYGMPSIDEMSVIDQHVETRLGQSLINVSADLGRMGTFQIVGSEQSITVTGSDPDRAALMQYEMGNCIGQIAFDPMTYETLAQAAGVDLSPPSTN